MSNSNYLSEINLCKNLFSLERFCSFCKPCNGLNKIEILEKLVMDLQDGAFYENNCKLLKTVKNFLWWKTTFLDEAFCQTSSWWFKAFSRPLTFQNVIFLLCREKDIFTPTAKGALKIFCQNLWETTVKELIFLSWRLGIYSFKKNEVIHWCSSVILVAASAGSFTGSNFRVASFIKHLLWH